MAKGQKRSNREKKKPKRDKKAGERQRLPLIRSIEAQSRAEATPGRNRHPLACLPAPPLRVQQLRSARSGKRRVIVAECPTIPPLSPWPHDVWRRPRSA